jgi:C-terminal processing protease CtpA/Prc
VIIDLRSNPGGNEAIIRPLIQVLNQKKVPVFVLIGRRTFSSAFGNALTIQSQLKGVLIGEPTGQKPNAFGEIEVFTLKNSRVKVQYSTKWWTRVEGKDPEALFPDIDVENGFESFTNGEDLVLQKALTHN